MTLSRPAVRQVKWMAGSMAWGVLLAVSVPCLGAVPPLMPLADVRAGQRGEVLTVYTGVRRERVPLEILGVAPDFAGPGRDLIVARLEGPQAERAGVVAGMSGSPVYIGDRLVGALSLRMGNFSREAIAGITPIQQMLAIPDRSSQPPTGNPNLEARYPRAPLFGLESWPEAAAVTTSLVTTPLAVSGMVPVVRELFEPLLAARGLGPWAAAVVSADGPEVAPLEPGDPVAAVLVSGDLTIAGTGTVTLVDGDRVLALGHPLVRAGDIDIPMARAQIIVTVPSQAGSFKLSRVGPIVGAFTQDRSAGLAGRLGLESRLIDVRVRVAGPGDDPGREFKYRIVRSPTLSVPLLELVLANTLMADALGGRGGTIYTSGSLHLENQPSVHIESATTGGLGGPPAALLAARHAATVFAALATSPFVHLKNLSVELEFRLEPRVQLLLLEEARLDRAEAGPGENVQVSVLLRDAEGGHLSRQTFRWKVPDLPVGTMLTIGVGDAAAVARATGEAGLAALRGAGSATRLVRALSAIPSRQGLYFWISRPAPGVILGAEPMPGLPPSVALLMSRDGTSRARGLLSQSLLHKEERRLAGVVSGSQSLTLEIR
ncbi:MAG: hypothetical protein O7A07_00580 [Acidobacteria bacterium]|nr:hypothetical protein [Acidobacteriota bacterium]